MLTVKTDTMRHVDHHCDLCVVGGGLSGMCAAISAAREGIKVVLIQDRPMFGGNCSSEIRMWVRGAKGECNRETGIISELEEENIYRNPNLQFSLWDGVMWGKVTSEKNIEVIMNCSVCDADTDGNGSITRVVGWQLTTYTWHTVYAKYFADCSGDSVLAPVVGALFRVGREAHSEFNEAMGHEKADLKTMGMSCLLQAVETDHKVEFIPPKWAYVYENDEDFGGDGVKVKEQDADFLAKRNASAYLSTGGSVTDIDVKTVVNMSRPHSPGTSGTNLWWLELGGEYDSIHDAEKLRDELIKIAYGIWDHIKNHGNHGADNWELEWVGCLPGKRESRRYVGRYILTENDVEAGGKFKDTIAYGGWPMDDHSPAGFYSFKEKNPPSKLYPAPSPYGIPYRSLYSANIKNLFFAGRNISATHAAMSSTRVMATCSLLGQAMGTAAAICVNENLTPDGVYEEKLEELQGKLMDAGCYLPGFVRNIPELSKSAKLNLSDADRELLFNGCERPDEEGKINYVSLNKGDSITFDFGKETELHELRVLFDLDYSRKSVSANKKMRVFAMRLHTGKDFKPMTVAAPIVKDFEVYADGKKVFADDDNYLSLRRISLDGVKAKTLEVRFNETHGSEKVHVFSCDVK